VEDKAREEFVLATVALVCAGAAVISSHPGIMLAALLVAIGAGTRSIDCLQTSAVIAYRQLSAPTAHQRLLPPSQIIPKRL